MTVGGVLANRRRRVWPPRTAIELLVHDLHDLLGGVEGLGHLGGQGPLTDGPGEAPDHGQRDVRVEQGATDLTDRRVDVRLGEAPLATEGLERRGQAVGQGREHVVVLAVSDRCCRWSARPADA